MVRCIGSCDHEGLNIHGQARPRKIVNSITGLSVAMHSRHVSVSLMSSVLSPVSIDHRRPEWSLQLCEALALPLGRRDIHHEQERAGPHCLPRSKDKQPPRDRRIPQGMYR